MMSVSKNDMNEVSLGHSVNKKIDENSLVMALSCQTITILNLIVDRTDNVHFEQTMYKSTMLSTRQKLELSTRKYPEKPLIHEDIHFFHKKLTRKRIFSQQPKQNNCFG